MNGRRMHRAWSGWNPRGFKNIKQGIKVIADGPNVSKWKNPEELIVKKKFTWRHIPGKVDRIVDGKIFVDPETVSKYKVPSSSLGVLVPIVLNNMLNGPGLSSGDIAIENAYELLTYEGEWYLDRSSSTLYCKPLGSDDFNAQS